jgi:hypothetical protein
MREWTRDGGQCAFVGADGHGTERLTTECILGIDMKIRVRR